MYVWDGDVWRKAHTWVIIEERPGMGGSLRTMQHGSTLSQDEYERLYVDSKADVARWMAEGSVHKVPAAKAGKGA